MEVHVATRNPVKLRAVKAAFAEWNPEADPNVRAIDPPERLPEQPIGDEVLQGAIARAVAAIESSNADRGGEWASRPG